MSVAEDARWMGAAITMAWRGVGLTGANPAVGCVIVSGGRVVGRGVTQPGGRPHAEAMALAEAGDAATDATIYVTLEPCAHVSPRGPSCADLLVAARPARIVVAQRDPDRRTDGQGIERLATAGIAVTQGIRSGEAARPMAGFLMRRRHGRPHVTLKLATSLDGMIARADGESRWITGPAARAHGHLERARADMIVVGAGTVAFDSPSLDVRLPGLESRSPARAVLTHGAAPAGWIGLADPAAIVATEASTILVEGGAAAAAAFLAVDLVDRLLLYRAPILIGGGRARAGRYRAERAGGGARPLGSHRCANAWQRHARSLRAPTGLRKTHVHGNHHRYRDDRGGRAARRHAARGSPPATIWRRWIWAPRSLVRASA